MRTTFAIRAAALAAIAVAGLLAACGPSRAELEAETLRIAQVEAAALAARLPPPVTLNSTVAQSAAVYVTYARDMATISGGFSSPEAVQAALRRGAAADPNQISRGLVAYASILALQSPEFVSGVRQAGADPEARTQIIARVVNNPSYAATLPGAEAAASLILGVLERDIAALTASADSVESDAYNIQYTGDQRHTWGRATSPNREGRLQTVKDLSARPVAPSSSETARLYSASSTGSGLGVTPGRSRRAPYAPSVTNALAMATLAALGAAGDTAIVNTNALQYDRESQDCLQSSKLNLYQCMAAARPNYEDMFCLGRHVLRDLSTCVRGASMPAAIITVGNPTQSRNETPMRAPSVAPVVSIPRQDAPAPSTLTTTPPAWATSPSRPADPAPATVEPGQSATQRLNGPPQS